MLTHRVIFSDNGVLTDYSLEAQSSDDFTFTVTAAQDYLYISQYLPFNSFYLQVGTANTEASVASIEYYSENEWMSVVDLLDGTKSSGITLARSGIIRFVPDEDEKLSREDTEDISELSSLTIYRMYWIRIKFSADTSAITLNKLSYKFAEDDIVLTLDPDINDYLSNWESGKTSWDEQLQVGSKHVVNDLKNSGMIKAEGQILLISEFELLTAYRTLAIIYAGLGKKFIEKRKQALSEYRSLLDRFKATIDIDNNARITDHEFVADKGRCYR